MSLYPILYPSSHKVQTSVGLHSDLDSLLEELTYITILSQQSFFGGLLILTRGIVEIPYFSSLSGRPRDNSNINMTAAWKKLRFILSVRSDFYMTDNLSIAIHAFASHVLMSFLIDETLLPR